MSFSGLAAWQAWALIAAAAGAAIALFLIKIRPPRIAVPSLLLWRRVLDDARARVVGDLPARQIGDRLAGSIGGSRSG